MGHSFPWVRVFAMVFELFQIILQAITTVLVAACLLLSYLHYLKINIAPNSGNPLGQFLLPMTNWLVLPLRRIMPSSGRIDVCALLASYLLVLAKTLLLLFLSHNNLFGIGLLVLAAFDWTNLVLSGLIGIVLVYALFSWTGTHSPTQAVFNEMVNPLLKPIRKIAPTISGIDFSSLILIVLIQMATVLLSRLEVLALGLI
ncbi:YggT family protein [Polynucleobacter sp. MWH-Aus1W21]|uniref:YggT family protein n=1 Tax=Polynucleobacter sp. MWH-Aus1W21 TaxID=1855880 RepID=UPI001BFD0596|nr:YggT family protein [Polynucleobacter sp. MWH-Aus1W21]QWD65726.1 YggT family protein [Polynucleobacter sp. MWH-Aus1W21]